MEGQDDGEREEETPPFRYRRRRRSVTTAPPALGFWRLLLGAWLLLLLVLAAIGGYSTEAVRPIGLGDVRHTHYLLGWIGDLAKTGAYGFARFFPLGFLAVLAIPPRADWFERVGKVLIPAFLGSVVAAAILIAVAGGRPGALLLLAPAVGSLAGVWLGSGWRRRRLWKSRPRVIRVFAVAAAMFAFAAVAGLFLALESRPLEIELPRVNAEEKRMLRELFRDKSPKALADGETATLRLTQLDVDKLGAWATALDANPERRARFEFEEDRVTLRASLGLPLGGFRYRFLNLSIGGEAAIDDGQPIFHAETLRLGRLEAPGWLLDLVSPLAMRLIRNDYRIETLLAPVKLLRIHQHALEVTYGRVDLPKGFISDLLYGEGVREEDPQVLRVRAYIEQILLLSEFFPRGDARFAAAIEMTFAFARDRSLLSDAVSENKAAILALGIMLGHWRLEQPIGKVLDDSNRKAAGLALRGSTLRGRDDWVKHFVVSASLVVLVSEGFSLGTGVFKEELDAQGGSGFSFGDLCADRAGTAFGSLAIRDEARASALQIRLARGFRVDDFFPPAEDLPEGLQDDQLEARFGGVGGEGYQKLVAEIERRVAAAGAYREQAGAPVVPEPSPSPEVTAKP